MKKLTLTHCPPPPLPQDPNDPTNVAESTVALTAQPRDQAPPPPNASTSTLQSPLITGQDFGAPNTWTLSMDDLVPFLLAIVVLFRIVTPLLDSLPTVQLWIAFSLGTTIPNEILYNSSSSCSSKLTIRYLMCCRSSDHVYQSRISTQDYDQVTYSTCTYYIACTVPTSLPRYSTYLSPYLYLPHYLIMLNSI